jgi:curli biogenesis system outer membrane secretion channel CsgG
MTTRSTSATKKTPTSRHSNKHAQLELEQFEGLLNDEVAGQQLSAVLLPALQKSECFASWQSSVEQKLMDDMRVIERKLMDDMRVMITEQMEKKMVAEDLTKQREERGGYSSLQELVNDLNVGEKLER